MRELSFPVHQNTKLFKLIASKIGLTIAPFGHPRMPFGQL